MRNKGYMTIFVSMLILALLAVFLLVYKIADVSAARAKSAVALGTACSSIKAKWTNEYIFEKYHILLIDMNAGGGAEEALTGELKESMEENLGGDYVVDSVSISGRTGILDDGCSAFKEQINDYFLYGVIENAAEELLDKTDGNDSPVTDEAIQRMDSDVDGISEMTEEGVTRGTSGGTSGGVAGSTSGGVAEGTSGGTAGRSTAAPRRSSGDPRREVRRIKRRGIPFYILPEDAVLSENVVDAADMPSYGRGGLLDFEFDCDFKRYSKLKREMNKGAGWIEGLVTDGEAIAYANHVFNSLNNKVNDNTYLNLEMEYIIGGKSTDAENYKKVINQITVIRFACNFAYLLTDAEKMMELDTLALELTFFFPIIQPLVKYLLAGCWAYVESVADVYCLVRGHKIPYVKTRENWKTSIWSIDKLEEIDTAGGDSDESGLDYDDYLMILMALNMKTAYYRMLDVMQMNVDMITPDFKMVNAATAYGADAKVTYKDAVFTLHSEDGY